MSYMSSTRRTADFFLSFVSLVSKGFFSAIWLPGPTDIETVLWVSKIKNIIIRTTCLDTIRYTIR